MKNYYIVLPVTPTNIVGVYGFIQTNKDSLVNIGGNNETLEIIPNPSNPLEASFRFELSEEAYFSFETELTSLGADVSDSAEAYLAKYPNPIISNLL
jgi:hypothetical protein